MTEEVLTTQEAKPLPDTKWYVLRVISGKEKKVKEYLDKEVRLSGWSNSIFQILCLLKKYSKWWQVKKYFAKKYCSPVT